MDATSFGRVAPAADRGGCPLSQAPPPLYDLIELMFFAYRDFVGDADRILAGDGFGRAHHRVLYFVSRRPGLTIAELLDILKITKQSLNRVLNDLLQRSYVTTRARQTDRRCRLLFATERGDALIRQIADVQSARFERVFAGLGEEARSDARAFLGAMIDGEEAKAVRSAALASGPRLRVVAGEGAFQSRFEPLELDDIDALSSEAS